MRYASLVGFTVLLTGCLTPIINPTTQYRLSPPIDVERAEPTDRVLGYRPIESARTYKQPIVYHDTGYVIGVMGNAKWTREPADVVTQGIADAIIATGRFMDVGYAGDLARPDLLLTGTLRKFDQDRSGEEWMAEVEVRFELRDVINRGAVWAETINVREPIEERSNAALADAMSKALGKVISRAANEIAKH